MKRLSFIYMLIGAVLLTSCLDDGESLADQISSSRNVAGFAQTVMPMSGVADGTSYDFGIRMIIKGPSTNSISEDVTVTVSVDEEASTAVENTHFIFESKSLTITPDDNNVGILPITLVTEGIETPLAENPKLVLNVESATGSNAVIASGVQLTINMLFLCPNDLSGTYAVTIDIDRCNSDPYDVNFPLTRTIEAAPGGGWYLSSADGGFLGWCTGNSGLANYGTINEVCGAVQPTNELQYGSLDLGTITGGTWDETTGVLILNNTQDFTGNWPGKWTSTYVRQ